MSKISEWFKKLSIGGKILVGVLVLTTISVAAGSGAKPAEPKPEGDKPSVEIRLETTKEPVVFETITNKDDSLAQGTVEVTQEGIDGEKTLSWEVTYTDGVAGDKKLVKEEVSKVPVRKIIREGTKVAAAPVPADLSEDSECDTNYSGCVPNVSYDLDCPDIGFNVVVYGSDPHGFDRDGDGYGCESY